MVSRGVKTIELVTWPVVSPRLEDRDGLLLAPDDTSKTEQSAAKQHHAARFRSGDVAAAQRERHVDAQVDTATEEVQTGNTNSVAAYQIR